MRGGLFEVSKDFGEGLSFSVEDKYLAALDAVLDEWPQAERGKGPLVNWTAVDRRVGWN